MREILFRGKTYDGEWVEGDYLNGGYDYKTAIRRKAFDGGVNYAEVIKVIPETVGQYTGLPDKNGKKIFEGDIHQYSESLFVVEFGAFYDVENDIDLYGFYLRDINYRNRTYLLSGDESNYFNIAGNIHDNPELLKGGADNG